MLQCVCSVLQSVAACCSVFAVCCRVLQCVAVCRSVSQCVEHPFSSQNNISPKSLPITNTNTVPIFISNKSWNAAAARASPQIGAHTQCMYARLVASAVDVGGGLQDPLYLRTLFYIRGTTILLAVRFASGALHNLCVSAGSGVVVAVCCSLLQCVAVCCCVLRGAAVEARPLDNAGVVLPRREEEGGQVVAVCSSVLQYVDVCCIVLQCVAVCCSVLEVARSSDEAGVGLSLSPSLPLSLSLFRRSQETGVQSVEKPHPRPHDEHDEQTHQTSPAEYAGAVHV